MSENRVLSLLCYSMMAYGESVRSDIYRRVSFIDCKKSGVQCYIGRSDDEMLIAFRGTDTIRDLLHDLMFLKRKIGEYDAKNIRVHSGFLHIYNNGEIRENIKKSVSRCDIRRVYITGHSLGAALAILCALDLSLSDKSLDVRCVVFGAPRVGNRKFARTFEHFIPESLRVECGNDAVAKLPPAIFGYRHTVASLHIGKPKIPFLYSLRDHNISEYFKSLITQRCSEK